MIVKHGMAAAALLAASLVPMDARAAEYPERTVDLVIPYAAGGGIDLLLRALAEGFSAHFKQSFVVSNRTGAGGAHRRCLCRALGAGRLHAAVRAGAGLFGAAADAEQRRLHRQILRADLSDVREPDGADRAAGFAVQDRARHRRSRAREGRHVSYAATAVGTITHLAAAALADTAKVKLNHVPFRGDGDLMGQLIGGHVDFASVTLASAAAAGPSVRVIGIFADARNPSLPDAPTDQGTGLRRRADELRRAVCAGRRAGRRAGQARQRLQVRGGAAGLRQAWPSNSTRARTTTPTRRPSPSGWTRT